MIAIPRGAVPALTMEQMREVDCAMVEDLHIDLVQMMENVGRNLAELALPRFRSTKIAVVAGPGTGERRVTLLRSAPRPHRLHATRLSSAHHR